MTDSEIVFRLQHTNGYEDILYTQGQDKIGIRIIW